jgi:hypothetical protein
MIFNALKLLYYIMLFSAILNIIIHLGVKISLSCRFHFILFYINYLSCKSYIKLHNLSDNNNLLMVNLLQKLVSLSNFKKNNPEAEPPSIKLSLPLKHKNFRFKGRSIKLYFINKNLDFGTYYKSVSFIFFVNMGFLRYFCF